MRIRTTSFASAIAVLALASACTSNDPNAKEESSSGEKTSGLTALQGPALDDGEACAEDTPKAPLKFGTYTDPAGGLDPAVGQQGSNSQLAAVYDTLMTYDYESGEFVPKVAESLTSNGDATEWTLKLRPEVTFGDGSAMTAEDVKASIERFQDPENPGPYSGQAALITSMDASDETTLVFKLAQPWGSFPYLLSQNPGMIVNPRVLAEAGQPQISKLPPAGAGAGAFVATSFTAGKTMTLEGKSDWWGGPVCLDELELQLIVDGQTAADTFESGQIQAFATFTATVQKQLQDEGTTQYVLPVPIISPAMINIAGGDALADVNLRLAMQHGMNLDAINERVFAGVGIPTAGLTVPGSPIEPTVEPLPYDEAAAKTAADEFNNAYPGTTIEYLNNVAALQENLAILQESQWKVAGLDVKHKGADQNQLIQQVYVDRNYDAVQWGLSPDPACMWCSLNAFESENPANITGYSDPKMDKALEELRVATTAEETKAAMDQVQTVWNETVPMALAGSLLYTVPVTDDVHGLRFGTNALIFFDKAYVG